MREDRADDHHEIVIEQETIDFDRHVHGEPTVRQLVDFLSAQCADLFQC